MGLVKKSLKYIHWLVPILVSLVVLIPVIGHGTKFMLLSGSTDSIAHMAFLSSISLTTMVPPNVLYWGRLVVGYPIAAIQAITYIGYDTLFLWFGGLAITGSIFTLYTVFSKLINRMAGLMVLLFAVLCAKGIISIYFTSVLFELINLYIILPIAVLIMVAWFTTHKQKYLWSSLAVFFIFSLFHTSGLYLAPVMAVFTLGLTAYTREWRYLRYGGAVIGLNLVLALALSPSRLQPISDTVSNLVAPIKVNVEATATPITLDYVLYYLPLVLITVLVCSLAVMALYRKVLPLNQGDYLVLWFILSFIIVLVFALITQASIAPMRVTFALSSMGALAAAITVGLISRAKEFFVRGVVLPVEMLLVANGMLATIGGWIKL